MQILYCLSWSYFFSPPSVIGWFFLGHYFPLGVEKSIKVASEDCSTVYFCVCGKERAQDAARDCTTSARLENALHR